MWYTRPAFVRAEFPDHGQTFESAGKPIEIGDRSDLCSYLKKRNGYLLVSGRISVYLRLTDLRVLTELSLFHFPRDQMHNKPRN